MIEKERVKKNFGKSAGSYESSAVIQKAMAKSLIEMVIKNEKNSPPRGTLLEIGCGTGFFSKLIIENIAAGEYLLTDISGEMVEKARENLCGRKEKIELRCADGEENFDGNFSIILSNATFQWFVDFGRALENLSNVLEKGGKIYFTIFAEGTFRELDEILQSIYGRKVFIQKFLSENEINQILNRYFSNVEIIKTEYTQYYDSVYEFLKQIKNVGANSGVVEKAVLTPAKLKKIEKLYGEKYSKNGKIYATSTILYCHAEKKEL